MIASVHVTPAVSLPVAVAFAALIGWYWRRLGRPDVPRLRCRVRRVSLGLQLITLPAIVFGLSFADPSLDRTQYVVVWSAVFGFLVLILASAAVDAVVSVRVERRAIERLAEEALAAHASQQRRTGAPDDEVDG